MSGFIRFLLTSVCLVAGLSSGAADSSPRLIEVQALPSQILRAVSVQALIEENQLSSDLNGKTRGFVNVRVELESKNDFHLYADKLKFWIVPDEKTWKIDAVDEPSKIQFLDPVSKNLKEGYRGQNVFHLKISLKKALPRPPRLEDHLPLAVSFQACDRELCLLPVAVKLDVSFFKNMSNADMDRPLSPLERAGDFLKTLLDQNGLSWLSWAILFLAGLLTAFTPCVYPLYPITIGLFSQWSQNKKISNVALISSYCLGLVLSYSIVGLIAAASGTLFGSLTQTPGFLLAVAFLISGSAVLFSGWISFQLPAFIHRFLGQAEEAHHSAHKKPAHLYLKASGMGAGLGLVASPCVGPMLIVLLAWLSSALAQSSRAYFDGFLAFFAFGVGMCLPLWIVAYVILKLGKRPRWGKHTPRLKNLGALLMLAASLFFWIPGFHLLLQKRSAEKPLAYVVYSLKNWPRDHWTLLDFRADWCAACLDLEQETFRDKAVAQLFEKGDWQLVRVDLTQSSVENQKIAQDYDVYGLPTVLVANPQGVICKKLSLFGFEGAKDFLKRLQSAPQNCQ